MMGREAGANIWDFSHCPNKYLLKENLCPAEPLIRQPGKSSGGNRTCPYREGEPWREEQDGARG